MTQLLVIEDFSKVAECLSSLFKEEGMEVFSARDGMEAITILSSRPSIELVILDLGLPQMDGYDFLTMKKKMDPISKIPVVIFTAQRIVYVDDPQIMAVLLKPIPPKDISHAISNTIQKVRYNSLKEISL